MLRQNINLKLTQKLSPQQIQLMKMLQLTSIELEEKIKLELEENPALEINDNLEKDDIISDELTENLDFENDITIDSNDLDIDVYLSDDEEPYYKTFQNNFSEENEFEFQQSNKITLSDHLFSQINTRDLSEIDLKICEFLIGNIDEAGYVRRELRAIINDFALYHNIFIEETYFENILLDYIQNLEPHGIGARNLQECLYIQLNKKHKNKAIENAILIIKNYFEIFAKNNYEQIKNKLQITEIELKEAVLEIRKLNPKPGSSYMHSNFQNQTSLGIIPDFIITIENNEITAQLNSKNIPNLIVSNTYKDILDTYKKTKTKTTNQKTSTLYIKQKLDGAKGFIDMLKLRELSLLHFINEVTNYQKNYFLSGNEKDLKPMILKDISIKTNLAISTISRLVNNKYIATPYGIKLIKELFSEGTKNIKGEEISVKEIKNEIQELINSEDKKNPITDINLLNELKLKGYLIARRTVTKYREKLNIPVARLRREL
ncbi:MAG: RNA polymerase factor sigma-54 [Solirubrobacteraceae bacterium]